MDGTTGPARPGMRIPLASSGDEVGDGSETVVVSLRDERLRESLIELRWRLDGLLEPGPSTLVIDVAGVTRLSSATVAVLLWVKRRCRARGVRVVLRRPSRRNVELLRRMGLVGALQCAPARAGSPSATSPHGREARP